MNFFLGYAYRTYEQIKTQIIDWLKVNLPENTDYNSSNPLVRIIELFSGIAQQIHYYIDFYAKEVFLQTARKFESQRFFAQNVAYRIKGATPANVELTFTRTNTTASLTIPQGTQVETQSGLVYETMQAVTMPIGTASRKVFATQRVLIESITFVSTGLASQRISLEPKIVDRQLEVSVLGEVWSFKENLAYSSANDKHYTTFIDASGNIEVIFGDNINGLIPILEAPIQINYYITEGNLGNVSPLAINKITSLSGLQSDLTVSNLTQATSGANQEGTTDLPKTIPLFIRTLERCVTPQDYIDVALQYPSLAKASVITSCGQPIELFIAPKSGGLASPSLISEVFNWIEERKVGKEVIVKPLGNVVLKLNLTAYSEIGAYQNTAKTNLIASITNFFSVQNQQASGSVYFSELFESMQNAIGIDKTLINSTQIQCYARAIETAPTLQGVITVKTTSLDTAYWELEITQVTPTVQYTLRRKLVGETNYTAVASNVALLTAYNDTRISMNLFAPSTPYTLGNKWNFVSYKHFDKVSDVLQLDEPSLITCLESDITLNMIGGLI